MILKILMKAIIREVLLNWLRITEWKLSKIIIYMEIMIAIYKEKDLNHSIDKDSNIIFLKLKNLISAENIEN